MTDLTTIEDQIAAIEALERQTQEAEAARLAEQSKHQHTLADIAHQKRELLRAQRLASLEAAIPLYQERADQINASNGELITALNEAAAELENIYNDALLTFGNWRDTAAQRESVIQGYLQGVDERTRTDGPPDRQMETESRQVWAEVGQADQKLPLAAMPQHAIMQWVAQSTNDTQRRIRAAIVSALFPLPPILNPDYDALSQTRREIHEKRRRGA